MISPAAAAWIFWLAAALVLYTYLGYPLLIALLARLKPRPVRRGPFAPTVSVVIAAWNEAPRLERRVRNLLDQDYPPDKLEIIVVSDGSTDATAELLDRLSAAESRVRPLLLECNQGKAAALNAGVAGAAGELIVFADARQSFAADAIRRLAENFADPRVGSASGELLLTDADGAVAANVGLYWRYEKWIRRAESATGSMLGATGAIYAIRRELHRPLPPGALLDDFLTPMRVVLRGQRAVFDDRALAFDRISTSAAQEFHRKVRTLAGNFQAFACEPGLLLPWRNPATWFQVWSHKLLRLVVPWALLSMFGASLAIPTPAYRLMALAQALFYGLALLGWLVERRGRRVRLRVLGLAYTFVALNLAAAVGLLVWLRRRPGRRIWRAANPAE